MGFLYNQSALYKLLATSTAVYETLLYIYSLAHGRDEWVFETVGVKSWQIESSFASQVIWTLMTWGKLVGETVIARIGDATQ